jgi:hypothetical protein
LRQATGTDEFEHRRPLATDAREEPGERGA